MEQEQPKTLYVGNLDISVTEELIITLFSNIGPVKGCKIIREPGGGDPYCFVEFANHNSAATALTAMNKRRFLEKEMKVNWASSPGSTGHLAAHAPKVDTSAHHHIFVGDLSAEIETDTLRKAFAPFGEISDCRVVKDMTSCKSKGFGFVSFVKKPDAQTAIEQMNGQFLGSRTIRTNWATRKPPSVTAARPDNSAKFKQPNYQDVYNSASAHNFTVYCGGLTNVDESFIRRHFSSFGRIVDVRYFNDKGYAFIKFDNKDSACSGIVSLNGKEIVPGMTVKCSWGKEMPLQGTGAPAQQPQQFSGAEGYGYPAAGMTPHSAAPEMPPQAYNDPGFYQQYYMYGGAPAQAAGAPTPMSAPPPQMAQPYGGYRNANFPTYGGYNQGPPPEQPY